MTTPLPTTLGYGTVRWTVVGVAEDSADAASLPDPELITGTVTFTPVFSFLKFIGNATDPVPKTILPRPEVYTLVGGVLKDSQGNPDVRLLANDSTETSPVGWSYKATYVLDNGYTFGEFFFDLATNEIVNLTLEVPQEDPSTGTLYVSGPAGPQGSTGLTGPAPVLAGTSATSTLIATGSKTFVTQAGMSLSVGQYIRLASAANNANYMAGNITAYAGTSMTVNVTDIGGSGTFADWQINITGIRGATGSTGAVPAITATSATSFVPAVGSKVFVTTASIPAFVVGAYVRIASTAFPSEYMAGPITAYSGTSLTVNVAESAGATARTDWRISLTGQQGPAGTPSDATTTAKGIVQLNNALGGVAATPTALGLNSQTELLELIRDTIGTAIVQGTGITVTVNDAGDTITIANSASLDAEAVQDIVGAFISGTSGVTATYNDTTNTLVISGTGIDTEAVQDIVGALITGSGLVTATYNDAGNTLTISTTATANDTDANLKNRANHTGTEPLAAMPGAIILYVDKAAGVWPARPTTRTDVKVIWSGPDPAPAIVTTPATNGMYAGDLNFTTP